MTLVCVAPVLYSSFAQRPHHMVAWFNELSGGSTLWINPYPGRLPNIADIKRPKLQKHQLSDDRVEVLSPPPWGADPLLAASGVGRFVWRGVLDRVNAFVDGRSWLLLISRPSLLALHLMRSTSPTTSAYDAMDNFPEFYAGCSRALSRRIERRIAHRVNSVLVSSTKLQEKFERLGVNEIELLHNGLGGEWTQVERTAAEETTYGYIGTVGPWFDWQLIDKMANSLPDVRFEIVGPVITPPATALSANVHLDGECAYEDVPNRLQRFAAGIIPFKINSLTDSVDPIKYYEYRAAGLPVLSTNFGEMRYRSAEPAVHLIHSGTDFPRLHKRLSSEAAHSTEELVRFRQENAWPSKFNQSRFLSAQAATAMERG